MVTLDPLQIARRTVAPLARPGEEGRRELGARLALLAPSDRLLMEMVFVDHLPVRRVGAVLGMPAGTASRRARRLWRRLHQPFVATLLARPSGLSDEQRQLILGGNVSRLLQGVAH